MRSGRLAIGRPRFVSANLVGNWRASDDYKVGAESLLPLPLVPSSQAQAFWRSWGVKIETTEGQDEGSDRVANRSALGRYVLVLGGARSRPLL